MNSFSRGLGQGASNFYAEIKQHLEGQVKNNDGLKNKSVTINYTLAGRDVSFQIKGKNLTNIESCMAAFEKDFKPKASTALNNNHGQPISARVLSIEIKNTGLTGLIDQLALKAGQAIKTFQKIHGTNLIKSEQPAIEERQPSSQKRIG